MSSAKNASAVNEESTRPADVGILALDVYFPRNKVTQADLEVYDGVSAGKYTVGLGQTAMAFTEDREDVVSMSLTVVQNLMEKYEVEPSSIGRLEVGTESSIDRSKSVKSFLMTLFKQSGNSDVQGVDCINACYGGTAALFNAVNWVESRSWDGRYAIVVAADVAVYASGPARPSGGCGAVAMLIGPDAPLVLEPGYSAAHMDNVYDFYKPSGIFPQVQGKLSMACYLTAVDKCYSRLCQKVEKLQDRSNSQQTNTSFSLADIDYCVMHAPFSKMVRKGFARLVIQDCLHARQASHAGASASTSSSTPPAETQQEAIGIAQMQADSIPLDTGKQETDTDKSTAANHRGSATGPANGNAHGQEGSAGALERLRQMLEDRGGAFEESAQDKELETAALAASGGRFERMAYPGTLLGRECGNMYAASVHASLASLVFNEGTALEGKRILASSFGSGLAASVFCIKARSAARAFSLASIASKLDLASRLEARRTATPEEFNHAIARLESLYGKAGYAPNSSIDSLIPGTYYLQQVDDQFRRQYSRKM